MAMTHEEQRQFAAIEQEFHRSHRSRFAAIRNRQFHNLGGRRRSYGLILMAVGLVGMLAALPYSTMASFVGFLVAIAGAWIAELGSRLARTAQRMLDRLRATAQESSNG